MDADIGDGGVHGVAGDGGVARARVNLETGDALRGRGGGIVAAAYSATVKDAAAGAIGDHRTTSAPEGWLSWVRPAV